MKRRLHATYQAHYDGSLTAAAASSVREGWFYPRALIIKEKYNIANWFSEATDRSIKAMWREAPDVVLARFALAEMLRDDELRFDGKQLQPGNPRQW